MRRVAQEGEGVVVVLRNHDTTRELVQRIREIPFARRAEAEPARSLDKSLRTYGAGAQILSDLGVQKMRILSSPKSLHGISGFDLEVVEYVDCD
jgi:3,4-dihydroxy 2-butanone 4-phosphate synthase/GTP cyclohydrolase II